MELGEGLSIELLERVKFEEVSNIKRIQERTPETLNQNFEEGIKKIKDFYLSSRLSEAKFPIFLNRGKLIRDLDRKVETFKHYFSTTLFTEIVHTSDKQILSEVSDYVILKSADKLAKEKGKSNAEIAWAQDELDKRIGSNGFIFANSSYLRSTNCNLGDNIYKIDDASDGCVIPLDIANISALIKDNKNDNADALKIFNVSRNLFSMKDFETFFAVYCASIFKNPQLAISLLFYYYHDPHTLAMWNSTGSIQSKVIDFQEVAIAKMRKLYVKYNIIPPFCPEFQFKNQIKAIRVERGDLKGDKYDYQFP